MDKPKVMTRDGLVELMERFVLDVRTGIGQHMKLSAIAGQHADALMGLCSPARVYGNPRQVEPPFVVGDNDLDQPLLGLIIAPDAPEAYDMEADAELCAMYVAESIWPDPRAKEAARRILKAKEATDAQAD